MVLPMARPIGAVSRLPATAVDQRAEVFARNACAGYGGTRSGSARELRDSALLDVAPLRGHFSGIGLRIHSAGDRPTDGR